ncbi:uncharacterized protein LOC141876821 isoform X2 [Acropora palmata]|uniref:uncharacterized protein LOC141876821 isoform X2 n=1 Tax=Acropora palmata TaxID=6131 RepID=UPI003DA014B3
MKSSRCVIFAIMILQSLSFSAVEAAVNSSLSVGDVKGTPRPPLNFSVGLENGQFTVRWEERNGWQQHALIKKWYTVTYYPLSKKHNFIQTKVVKDSTVATLTDLEIFTVYCVRLFIQFENGNGIKTAPSDRLGPLCHKTKAGEPSNQPQIVTHKDYLFPDDSSVRDVAVEWKPALPSSWNGPPGKFVIYCYYSFVEEQKSLPKACEYDANATANSTVLRGLNSGDNYTVFMDKCNEEGKCSGQGKPYRINAVGGDDRKLPEGGEFTKAPIAGISLLVILCVVSAVAGVYWIRKGRRERRRLDIFHDGEDEPDLQYDYDEIDEKKNEYNRVL